MGIEPVPERLRILGLTDTFLLWTNLGISLLVLVLPGFFDLSLGDALLATLVGGLIGNTMLAVAGLIGADGRVPTMVLQRAPLGHRGSYLATALNVLQCFGWAIFELIVIATAAGLLCDKLFGFRATWMWTLLFGALTTALALLGPIGFVRRYVRKVAIWAVIASLAYLTWWILDGAGGHHVWSSEGHHGSFWAAVDIVIAVTVSWAPLVADYTRFSRDRKSAFFGVGFGYLLPTLFQFGFGSVLVLSRVVDPNKPELILTAIAGGGLAAALCLLALTVDETDEAFANVYSAGVSLQNLVPKVPQRLLLAVSSVIATGGALLIDLRNYQTFLSLLGSFFVPLLGVLIADWLVSGARYTSDRFFAAPAVRPAQVAAWLVGFGLYQWLYPNGPSWWLSLIHHDTAPFDVTASLPSFGAAFVLSAVAGLLARRPTPLLAET
ncbi:MAG TPA: cytosine permease [Gaiellaceae bacterium]|nr:cytosine permease [Gaiellaceae bacterium]